jgi:hypothetical protein
MAPTQEAGYLASMKATIEFEDALYRRLKVEAARRGVTIRDLVAQGARWVLRMPDPTADADPQEAALWFGTLRDYADNAAGAHDLAAMRRSIARKRGTRSNRMG